jgi:hypothetical protein
LIYVIIFVFKNKGASAEPSHGRRDSNSRHLVLETSALPTELHPFVCTLKGILNQDTL